MGYNMYTGGAAVADYSFYDKDNGRDVHETAVTVTQRRYRL